MITKEYFLNLMTYDKAGNFIKYKSINNTHLTAKKKIFQTFLPQ